MHNITETDKQEGLVQAWHGLTVIRPDLDLEHNWLKTWEPENRQVYIKRNGDLIELPVRQLVASDDDSILIGQPFNPDTFRPLTNAEFLKMIEDATSGTEHKLVSIGTIRGRGRRFASFNIAKLGSFTAGGRSFDPYLNFGDGLDKSSVLWANTSNICTVCDNTFSMNLASVENGNNIVNARHTKNIALRLPSISDLVDKAVGVQAEFAAAFEQLATQPVKVEQATRIYAGFVAAPDVTKLSTRGLNIVDRLTDLFKTGKGNKGESRADLFSAATDYYTHESSGKNTTSKTRQLESSDYGTGAQRKQEFFKIVRDDISMEYRESRGAEVLAASKA